MFLKRCSSLLAVLATLHSGVAPAAAAQSPYFRMQYGLDDDQARGLQVTGGPSGKYYVRTGGVPAMATPSASESPVTWSVTGSFPDGLTVDPRTGAIGGAAGTVADFGPANLVAIYKPADGSAVRKGAGPAFAIQVLGTPFIAYAPPPTVPSGVRTDIRPRISNVASGTYALNQPVPAGLAFDTSSGMVSVLPGATGTFSGLAVTVTDIDKVSATSSPFAIAVGTRTASISITNGQPAVRGVPFSLAINTLGLASPVRYDTVTGSLPPGMSYCASPDRVCGTPSQVGTYAGIYVSGTGADNLGAVTQSPLTIAVVAPTLSYADTTATVGKPFTVVPKADNLDGATYAFGGTAPAGIKVDPATGLVSGTLGSTDPVTVSVVATTQYGTTASNPFALTGRVESFAVTAPSYFLQAHVGYPIRQQFTASNGVTGLTWAVTSGKLPDGLALTQGGLVWGSGTAPANVDGVVITGTAGGKSASSDPSHYEILSQPSIAGSSAYTATVGSDFSAVLTGKNLIGSGTFTADANKLPPGLTLSKSGTIAGQPTQAGSFDGIVVTVTDAYDGSAGQSQPFTIEVTSGDGSMAATGVPASYRVRQDRSLTTQAPVVTGTTSTLVWSLAPDSAPLPAGMTLNPSTGVISGTPTTPGDTANIILQATEVAQKSGALGLPAGRIRLASNDPSWIVLAQASTTPKGRTVRTRPFTITVGSPLTVGNVQQQYNLKVAAPVTVVPQANGVMGATSWTLSGGTLPNAVSFDPVTGRIAGPALTAGRVPGGSSGGQLVVSAIDSFDGAVASSKPFAFTIDPGLVVVGPTALGTKASQAYDSGVQFNAVNGQTNLTWRAIGSLPDGFSVVPSTGAIRGQSPTPSIVSDLRMQAIQDDGTAGVSAPFTFIVQGGLQISYPAYVVAHLNVPMPPITPTVVGSQGTVSWSVASGSLPPGVTMNTATGALIGTPTAGGFFYNIQIGATDATGNSGVSQPITLYINNGLSWGKTISSPQARRGNKFVSSAPQVLGATGPVTYRLVATIWDWKVDPNTGVVSGADNGTWYGSYIWQDWLIASDATGAAVSHPTLVVTGTDPLAWGCDYNGPGGCTTTVKTGTPAVAPTEYLWGTLGTLTFSKVGDWPDWLSLDTASGRAFGTPPTAGTYAFNTMMTDGFDNSTATRMRYLVVQDDADAKPRFTGPGSACAVTGQPFDTGPGYIQGISGATVIGEEYFGGNVVNMLPPFLTMDQSNGRITGTVPYGSTADFGIKYGDYVIDPTTGNRVNNNNGWLYVNTYSTLNFDLPQRLTSGDGYTVGGNYSNYDRENKSKIYGGRDNLRVLVTAGQMPPGMYVTNDGDGAIYGNPTTAGSYTATITMTATQCGGVPVSVSKDVTITVKPPQGPWIDNPLTVYARVGVPFRGPKPAILNEPRAGINWYVDFRNGGLPAGMRLDSGDGSIYGTATQTWNDSFRYQAQGPCCDWFYAIGNWSNLIVTPGPSVKMTDVSLPTGVPANVVPNATGFAGRVTWKGANLPPGLGVDPATGAIVGSPTTDGTYASVTVTGTEATLASIGPNDPNPVRPSATSNPFTITVVGGPYITNVGDQSRIIGAPFDIQPVANGFSGPVRWRVVGDLPEGVVINAATGAISGGGTKYGVKTVQVIATDGGNTPATSARFKLTVTDRNGNMPTGEAVWTWGPQVCTYGCVSAAPVDTSQSNCTVMMGQTVCTAQASGGGGSGGSTNISVPGNYTPVDLGGPVASCSGRQIQRCNGEGCEARVRGCDAPYSGGDTSYPEGSVAISCVNPTLDPSDSFCPRTTTLATTPTEPETPAETPTTGGGTVTPTAPAPTGTWYYNNYYRQTKGTAGFIVNYYSLGCYVGTAPADNSRCGTPPTSIGQCMVNGYGQGTCGSGVGFTDGITQSTFVTSTAGWFDSK